MRRDDDDPSFGPDDLLDIHLVISAKLGSHLVELANQSAQFILCFHKHSHRVVARWDFPRNGGVFFVASMQGACCVVVSGLGRSVKFKST